MALLNFYMPMLKKYCFAFLLTFFSTINFFSQENEIEYANKITISDGLAHNGVTSVLKDSNGFLWIGTYGGINKYDGYKLVTFKNTIDKDILTSNRIRAIAEDSKKNLWIGTDQGITIYKYSQEKFKKLYSNKLAGKDNNGPIIRKVFINKKNDKVYCLTEGNGVFLFDENYKFINQFVPLMKESNHLKFYDVLELNNGNLVFATSSGLYLFNVENNSFQKLLSSTINSANAIIRITDSQLLVSLENGIAVVNYNQKSNQFNLENTILKENQFNSLRIDDNGDLWLGTLNKGIIKINDVKAVIGSKDINHLKKHYFNDNTDRLRISSIISSSNNIWVGTFNKGLYEFDIKENPFKKYNKGMNYKYGITSNFVTNISSLDSIRAYVSATFGGIGLFNSVTGKFESLPFHIPEKQFLNVSSVFVDSRKDTWLKITGIGFFRVKKGEKKLEKIENDVLSNTLNDSFRSYSEDKFGNIWIGTSLDVFKIALNKSSSIKSIESLNSNPFFNAKKIALARYVYSDYLKNYIWIGADSDGLFRIENKENTPLNKLNISQFVKDKKNKKSLSSNFVTSIVRLPNKELWVGTESGGICKIEEKEGGLEFFPFTEKEGLSNNVVKSIQYDNDNSLWVSTNIGLNKFDLKSKVFRKFNLADGLPFEDFWFSSGKLDNGTLFFSGLDGFCYFNPTQINAKEELPKVWLENFKLFNQKINPGDTISNQVILSKKLSELNTIELNHNQNVFSFDIVSLHFSNPKNHSLRYKLYPINKDWVETSSNNNTINYSGLQPGEYELSYMASNSLNEWTTPKKLKIVIVPPFWETNTAYFIYVLLIIIILYFIIFIITKIQSLNHNVAIEKLEKDNVKELNESKLRFFSNISHEIKTPITLISGPVDVLLDRYKNNLDVSEKLGLVKRQTKKIKQLVDQVHDFRRAEANLLKMNYSRFNFNIFLQELANDFMFLANKDQKNFELIAKNKNIIVSGDKNKIEKICNNLINNAFKYTKAGDAIKIEFSCNEKDLIVSVSDTGMGIDEVDLEHVFERFYQSEFTQKEHIAGSGIGLAFSKKLVEMHYGYISATSTVNEGTTISFQLPIVKQQVEEDEVLDKKTVALPKEKEIIIDKQILDEANLTNVNVSADFTESLVFYAEDNLEMRTYVTGILSKYFTVKAFRDGQECLDALENNWPDIVISDVQMPNVNGLDLCISIKSDLKTSHIPVILLTALTDIEDHVRGLRDGADAYIKKPFNVQRLITNIEALLNNRKQLRERYQVGIPLTKENNKNNRNDNAFLEKLYSIMEENLDNQDFDINTLAKELYLNRTHFYQKVKVLTNQTPFELIKMYRLKKAAQFLVHQKLSVNEVFLMTGFKSRTHFTKIFKEKYNVSPSKYAAENENKLS
ncbi:hybrid sensor histidine kinase/response regulator transcription factor [Polaribacter sp. Q13]|uniref:hybrid sensor histidine kinase/response regulator transcription factor n=1 Tax=Polaribacter sp. Q13 TaxID=2806551 RepID=UPI00193B0A7E|nr:hybrid sensor histidine kinase/response regulator transcription factor [Polaribacter sp. Q13]QVY65573.1 response regulator [Polaribacter sp. Q13]